MNKVSTIPQYFVMLALLTYDSIVSLIHCILDFGFMNCAGLWARPCRAAKEWRRAFDGSVGLAESGCKRRPTRWPHQHGAGGEHRSRRRTLAQHRHCRRSRPCAEERFACYLHLSCRLRRFTRRFEHMPSGKFYYQLFTIANVDFTLFDLRHIRLLWARKDESCGRLEDNTVARR